MNGFYWKIQVIKSKKKKAANGVGHPLMLVEIYLKVFLIWALLEIRGTEHYFNLGHWHLESPASSRYLECLHRQRDMSTQPFKQNLTIRTDSQSIILIIYKAMSMTHDIEFFFIYITIFKWSNLNCKKLFNLNEFLKNIYIYNFSTQMILVK